jgi:hypothetical protein
MGLPAKLRLRSTNESNATCAHESCEGGERTKHLELGKRINRIVPGSIAEKRGAQGQQPHLRLMYSSAAMALLNPVILVI